MQAGSNPYGKHCQWCGSFDTNRVKVRIANGSFQVRDLCAECGRNANGKGINVPHKFVRDLDSLPLYADYVDRTRLCMRCGSAEGVELHHYAPQAAFPDANSWPTQDLCLACHRYWHDTLREYYKNGGI